MYSMYVCQSMSECPGCSSLKSASHHQLKVLCTRTNYRARGFVVSGPAVWNSLPAACCFAHWTFHCMFPERQRLLKTPFQNCLSFNDCTFSAFTNLCNINEHVIIIIASCTGSKKIEKNQLFIHIKKTSDVL